MEREQYRINCINNFTYTLIMLDAHLRLIPAKNVNKYALQNVAMLYVGVLYMLKCV